MKYPVPPRKRQHLLCAALLSAALSSGVRADCVVDNEDGSGSLDVGVTVTSDIFYEEYDHCDPSNSYSTPIETVETHDVQTVEAGDTLVITTSDEDLTFNVQDGPDYIGGDPCVESFYCEMAVSVDCVVYC